MYHQVFKAINGEQGIFYESKTGTTANRDGVSSTTLRPQIWGPGDWKQKTWGSFTCNAQNPAGTWSVQQVIQGPISIQRPTISGVDAIWYLGSPGLSDPTNGIYNTSALSGNKNCASCTSALQWEVSPAGALSFSPTSGASTTATSQRSSSSCTRDITVRAKLDGFYSDPFNMIINRPNFTIKNNVSHGPCGRAGTTPCSGPGYASLVQLYIFDLCSYHIPSIAINEQFGAFYPDMSNNWPNPTPRPAPYFVTTFSDEIAISGYWTPQPYAPVGPLSTQKVNWANQWIYAGSTTSGQGQLVNTVPKHQKYVDHGDHQ